MRTIALASLALALSACGGGGDATGDEANALSADNMMMDENLMMDPNLSANGTMSLDSNGAANSATQNLMAKDARTNDPDTNLANGL
jgi:hypothetical protein